MPARRAEKVFGQSPGQKMSVPGLELDNEETGRSVEPVMKM